MSHHYFEPEDLAWLQNQLPAYKFECLSAQDGTSALYKARQISLDRDVSIKFLSRKLDDERASRHSFEAEAKAMARLAHTNLIKVYDFGELDGVLYIVMEYIPGKSLFHSAHQKAIDPAQAVEIVIAACSGLAHAHENGVVHRDINPANILLTLKCEPKIGEFGLACCSRGSRDGLAKDSPEYRAPEVMDHPERGNQQSDVFSLGVVLSELLTGIPAGDVGASTALVSDPGLAEICRKATHSDLALRYPSASVFAGELTQWKVSNAPKPILATRRPPSPRPTSQRPTPIRQAKRKPSAAWTLLKNCAVITGLACSGYLSWSVYQLKANVTAKLQQAQSSDTTIQSLQAAAGEGFKVSIGEGETFTNVTVQVSYLDLIARQGAALAGRATE